MAGLAAIHGIADLPTCSIGPTSQEPRAFLNNLRSVSRQGDRYTAESVDLATLKQEIGNPIEPRNGIGWGCAEAGERVEEGKPGSTESRTPF